MRFPSHPHPISQSNLLPPTSESRDQDINRPNLLKRSLVRRNLDDRRTILDSLIPGRKERELLLDINVSRQPANQLVPGSPGQIGVGVAVANEVVGLGLAEVELDDAEDAADLALVAGLGRGELLGVVVGEPGFLAEVGALAGGLEVEPLVLGVLLLAAGVVELVGGVVGLGEVLEDGAGLVGCQYEMISGRIIMEYWGKVGEAWLWNMGVGVGMVCYGMLNSPRRQ